MRSVKVVLPASMWAQIPMLRVRSSGYSRLGEFRFSAMLDEERLRADIKNLPAEMGEGAVGLRLLVDIVALAHGVALVGGGVLELIGQGHVHRGALAAAGEPDDPAHRQRFGAARR